MGEYSTTTQCEWFYEITNCAGSAPYRVLLIMAAVLFLILSLSSFALLVWRLRYRKASKFWERKTFAPLEGFLFWWGIFCAARALDSIIKIEGLFSESPIAREIIFTSSCWPAIVAIYSYQTGIFHSILRLNFDRFTSTTTKTPAPPVAEVPTPTISFTPLPDIPSTADDDDDFFNSQTVRYPGSTPPSISTTPEPPAVSQPFSPPPISWSSPPTGVLEIPISTSPRATTSTVWLPQGGQVTIVFWVMSITLIASSITLSGLAGYYRGKRRTSLENQDFSSFSTYDGSFKIIVGFLWGVYWVQCFLIFLVFMYYGRNLIKLTEESFALSGVGDEFVMSSGGNGNNGLNGSSQASRTQRKIELARSRFRAYMRKIQVFNYFFSGLTIWYLTCLVPLWFVYDKVFNTIWVGIVYCVFATVVFGLGALALLLAILQADITVDSFSDIHIKNDPVDLAPTPLSQSFVSDV